MLIPDIFLGFIIGVFCYHVLVKRLVNSKKYQKYKTIVGMIKGGNNDN